jgi:uncharacterized membrane protein
MMLKVLLRWLLAAFFILAGVNHFRMPGVYAAMVPPWLPWPERLSAIAGALEILGGIGVLIPEFRRRAGWGLVILLVAVFPANLHVALVGHMEGLNVSSAVLWLRLPFQAVLIAWVAWVAIVRDRSPLL